MVTAFFRRISLFPRCETTTRNRVPSKEKVYLYHMNILDFRAGNRIVVSQPPPACAHMFARNSRSSLTIRAGARLSAIIIYIYIYACRFGTCASLTSSERVQQRYIAENVVRARARAYTRGGPAGAPLLSCDTHTHRCAKDKLRLLKNRAQPPNPGLISSRRRVAVRFV